MQTYTCPSGHVVLLDDDVVLPGKLSIGSHGYAQVTGVEHGVVVLLHRWLLGLVKGDGKIADHRNRNRLDNRRENLRVVTYSESNINLTTIERDLPRGVYRARSGRFVAAIKRDKHKRHLGTFNTAEEAIRARELAAS